MIKKGQKVSAKISSIVPYGAFCEVVDEDVVYKGLIHISEISDYFVSDIHTHFDEGESYEVEVIDVVEEKKQLKLSFKSLRPELHKSSDDSLKETGSGFDGLDESLKENLK